jgi:hypothetical protein
LTSAITPLKGLHSRSIIGRGAAARVEGREAAGLDRCGAEP